jgi:MscS family membrane protein
MKHHTRKNLAYSLFAALAIFLLLSTPGWAQDKVPQADASMRDVLENADKADRLVEEREQSDPKSANTRNTPLASLLGLRKAMKKNDLTAAGEFLDLRYLPEELDEFTPEQLVKAFIYVWGQQNIIDISSLSDEPEGHLDDGLPSYRDQIGVITLSAGEIPIYVQRVPDGRGGKAWKISNATVAEIPAMWRELGYSPMALYLQGVLPDFQFMGMENWQVVTTAVFLIFAWPLAALFSHILMRIALLIPNRFPLGIQRFFKGPMRFFLFVLIAKFSVGWLGLSLTARVLIGSSGIGYIAGTVLLMGLISLIRDYQIRKLQYAGRAQYAALLKPMTTIIKVILVVLIALFWADSAGYNMSTILAGLGVGSLAVALAAQKTLENLIGAVTLYAARPVGPGDFCRFGTVVGTVEEIGLRSTTIRTLNRTLVVIPNSVFSAIEIENFSERDRIRFYQELRLNIAEPGQLTECLEEMRKLFLANEDVVADTVSIRFFRIDDATAILRLDSCVATTDYQAFLATAEELNLGIVKVVRDAGASFSGPSKTVKFDGDISTKTRHTKTSS